MPPLLLIILTRHTTGCRIYAFFRKREWQRRNEISLSRSLSLSRAARDTIRSLTAWNNNYYTRRSLERSRGPFKPRTGLLWGRVGGEANMIFYAAETIAVKIDKSLVSRLSRPGRGWKSWMGRGVVRMGHWSSNDLREEEGNICE